MAEQLKSSAECLKKSKQRSEAPRPRTCNAPGRKTPIDKYMKTNAVKAYST